MKSCEWDQKKDGDTKMQEVGTGYLVQFKLSPAECYLAIYQSITN